MRVNEIFYSIQGEGYNTGRAAVFIRLSGCNLKCPFCDTDFTNYTEMTQTEIVDEVLRQGAGCRLVVITGGEPTLYDCTALIDELHQNDFEVAMESNGTRKAPFNVDYLTISPKMSFVGEKGKPVVQSCFELKLIYDGKITPSLFGIKAKHYYLQPCDTGDVEENRRIQDECIDFIKKNPKWKLSLQTQKILRVR